jgi:hypothetical protein
LLRKEGLNVIDIKDPIATIDASDVFFTGKKCTTLFLLLLIVRKIISE